MVNSGRKCWSTNLGGPLLSPQFNPMLPLNRGPRQMGGATQHFESWGAGNVKSEGRHFLVWKASHIRWEYTDREGQDVDDFMMAQEESRIIHGQPGAYGSLGKGGQTLTGKSGEGCRVGGGKASPFPMPTASMLKVNWPRPRPRPPPRLAMMEGAWGFRHPIGKT